VEFELRRELVVMFLLLYLFRKLIVLSFLSTCVYYCGRRPCKYPISAKIIAAEVADLNYLNST
jgi:hypothetical protein